MAICFVPQPEAQVRLAPCPPDSDFSRGVVEVFLFDDDFSAERSHLDLAGVDTGDIELVTDRSVCKRFSSPREPYNMMSHVIYKVGTYYVYTLYNPGGNGTGVTPILFYDRNFDRIVSFVR